MCPSNVVNFSFFIGKKIDFVGISFKQCVGILSMSLFNFFQPVKDKAKGTCSDVGSKALSLSNKDKNGIYREELMII